MKPQSLHAQEDRLLDFAYGELPPLEARVVESHLEGCPRCTELLAGIRGVRSTMAQLPRESAPDTGLESLMAYAQQAARNAAAGPAPKPTWWRRWLVPTFGLAAVSAFGLVTVQVSKQVDLSPDLSAKLEAVKAEAPVAAPPPAPIVAAPSPVEPAEPMAGMTPPPPAPPAKLDTSTLDKGAPRKKGRSSALKDAAADYSNAGAGGAFERDSYPRAIAEKKTYDYDRRDAMTQSGAFSKPKPLAVSSVQGAPPAGPAPAQAEPPAQAAPPMMDEEASADDGLMVEAQVQQEAPPRGSLRVGGGVGSTAEVASAGEEEARTSNTRREQRTRSAEAPAPAMAPPPRAPSMAPAPASAPAGMAGRAERPGPSPAELSKLAYAALREGNRVREAQLLRQALQAGATGKERLGLLSRLCDAEFAIGRRQAAIEACTLVLEEDPRSSAAQMARGRLRREAPESMPTARPGSKAAPLDEREAPATAAPAEAP